MDPLTILIIVVVILLLCGGGFGYTRRATWGSGPMGIVGLLVLVLIIYLVLRLLKAV